MCLENVTSVFCLLTFVSAFGFVGFIFFFLYGHLLERLDRSKVHNF